MPTIPSGGGMTGGIGGPGGWVYVPYTGGGDVDYASGTYIWVPDDVMAGSGAVKV